MAIIKGQNLRILFDGKFVAFAQSCDIHVSKQLEECSSKDSAESWTEQEVTGKSWDLSTDALFSVGTSDDEISGVDALDLILSNDEAIDIIFSQTSGEMNRDTPGAGAVWKGKAIINDIHVNATNRKHATYSLQAQGQGALVKA